MARQRVRTTFSATVLHPLHAPKLALRTPKVRSSGKRKA